MQEAPAARPVLVVLALAVGLGFLGLMLGATEGHFVPQVVDLFVVCQYAKAFAEGHPFRYNPGEPPSTGATSLLHTLALGLAHALGIRGEGLVAFAIVLGALLYMASVLVAERIAARLGGPREGLLGGLLVALGGPVVWAYFSGGDIGLFMMLALLLFERLLAAWEAPEGTAWRGVVTAASLLALARPEGLFLALAAGGALWLGPLRGAPASRRRLAWLPLLLALAMFVLYRALTGYWGGSSVSDKSLLASYGATESLALVTAYAVDVIRGLLLGFYPSHTPVGLTQGWAPIMFPPLGLLLVLMALVRVPVRLRPPTWLWAGLVAFLFAAIAPNVFMGVHFNRYLLWAFPSLLVLVAVGLGRLTDLLAREDETLERSLFRAGAALLLALGLLSTARFAAFYGSSAGEIWRRDVAAAQWIVANLPPGVRMANLATSVEYLTGHHNLNLHGVTTPAFFGNRSSERDMGVWEALAHLTPAERPAYLITSESMQAGSVAARELADGQPLFRTNAFGDELLIFRTRFDLVGGGREPLLAETLAAVHGRNLVDQLNVGDAADEAAHGYEFESRLGPLKLHGTLRADTYELPGGPQPVVDGGRAIIGWERFSVRTQPGRELRLVLRTAQLHTATVYRAEGVGPYAIGFAEAGMILEVNGQTTARSTFRPRATWDEQVVFIPASLVASERTELRLRGRYASFRYWLYQ